MPKVKLITRAQWDKLAPRNKGYAYYLQSALPGSELKDVGCPYPVGSDERREFAAGEFTAMMEAQEGDDG